MAKLTTKKRKSLKPSTFGIPSERKYPMDDREHAANAKGRAKQQLDKGKLSLSKYKSIITKANRILKKTKKK